MTVARDSDRIRRIKTALRASGLDALILRMPENIVMAFGIWPMNGFSYALFTASDGPVALIAPSCEDREMDECWAGDVQFFVWPRLGMDDPLEVIRGRLRELARRHGLGRAKIGYEGSFEAVAPPHNAGEPLVPCESSIRYLRSIFPSAAWCDATALLHTLRATKTAREIAKLRIAHRAAGFGLEKFHQSVGTGISEAELAGLVYAECLARAVEMRGVRHVNVYPQVSGGANAHRAWRPVVTTGRRRLKHGEIAVLELAVCVDGFWADVTRVKAAGRPSTMHNEAFAAVLAAQAAALRAIKPGVAASRPHEAATKVLVDAGFAGQVVHLTGHGVGFRYHEPEPFLMPGNEMRLRRGHVCTVEPGLYDPAWGGIRLEDNIVVTSGGADVLSKTPKEL
jgi:Xaa-Pro dipeptidase